MGSMTRTWLLRLTVSVVVFLPVACGDGAPDIQLAELVDTEITRLEQSGFKADQVIHASLDGDDRIDHVAMRLTPREGEPSGTPPSQDAPWNEVLEFSEVTEELLGVGQAFLLFELRGDELLRIFDRVESSVALSSQAGPRGFRNPLDVDGDGSPEIVVSLASGGNCFACVWLEIYTVADGSVRNIIDDATGIVGAPHGLEDIDRDGSLELLVGDDTFEFAFGLCHACSPALTRLYEFGDGEVTEVSAKHPAYYDSQIAEIESNLAKWPDIGYAPDAWRPEFADSSRITMAIQLFLRYEARGDPEKGWREYKSVMDPAIFLTDGAREQVRDINLGMAHAFGFNDFGAQEYLRSDNYPDDLKEGIMTALESAERPNPPYQKITVDLGRASSVPLSVRYETRLDYFFPFYNDELDLCSSQVSDALREVLRMDKIEGLPIFWQGITFDRELACEKIAKRKVLEHQAVQPEPSAAPPLNRDCLNESGDVSIEGSVGFQEKTRQALRLLPQDYHWLVVCWLQTIREGPTLGVHVMSGTFNVTNVTFSSDLPYYASSIVHDAIHVREYWRGKPYSGRDGELAALVVQVEVLRLLGAETHVKLIETYIANIDNPAYQYWNRQPIPSATPN
jgi:hypothetical protein